MKNNLNDVLMAQDFQDLTGQIITRVITLVEEVEGNLVELIRLTGDRFAKPVEDKEADTVAEGPHVPGVGNKDVVANQDDVDDLLSSLGF
jgi:chemotaxis protein CheZ